MAFWVTACQCLESCSSEPKRALADPTRANERAKLEHFKPIMDLAAGTTILANVPGIVDPFAENGNAVEQWNRAAEIRLALAQQP